MRLYVHRGTPSKHIASEAPSAKGDSLRTSLRAVQFIRLSEVQQRDFKTMGVYEDDRRTQGGPQTVKSSSPLSNTPRLAVFPTRVSCGTIAT